MQISAVCPNGCSCIGDKVNCAMVGMHQLPSRGKWLPSNLTSLNLNHNKLKIFTTKGLQTEFLEVLSMRNNSITVFIDKERKRYPELTELDLSMNDIRWISMGLFQRMRNLQKVNLSGNKLISLSSIRIPPSVWSLDLSYNKIEQIPSQNFMQTSSNLRELDLSHNLLKSIPQHGFDGLINLGVLNLDGNKISELSNKLFYELISCYRLSLRDNEINEIDTTTFLNLGVEIRTGGNLAPKIIDLRNNKMNVILRDWVNALGGSVAYCKRNVCPEPFKILLEHNEIYCDCNMQQVKDEYDVYFGDLENTSCVNEQVSVADFHDEICCNTAI